MKKLTSLIIIMLVICTIASIALTLHFRSKIEISRYEEEPMMVGTITTISNIGINDLHYFCNLYYSRFSDRSLGSIYIPREGKFETSDGEVFTVKFGKCVLSKNVMTPYIFGDMKVFSENGELIAEGKVYSTFKYEKTTNDDGEDVKEFLYVEDLSNEELRKYWDASKILGKDLFNAEKEDAAK